MSRTSATRFTGECRTPVERFDVFLGDVRRLARSCQSEGVEESMIRDRFVVSIRDDAAAGARPEGEERHRHLQSQ